LILIACAYASSALWLNDSYFFPYEDEARNFELKITDAGNLTFGAEGSHKHDDLIMALSTANFDMKTPISAMK